MNRKLVEKLVKFARLHKEVMQRQIKLSKRADVIEKLAEHRIPEVVDNLVTRGIIEPEAKEATEHGLRDHAKCLLFIDNLAAHVRPGAIGTTVTHGQTKRARRPRFIGEMVPEDERESGRAFKEAILGRRKNVSLI